MVVHPNGDISDPNKPPGWWPVVARWPTVDGKQSRRKGMGSQVHEQETYGVDYVTGRDVVACFRLVLPEYDDDELWAISDQLMMQVSGEFAHDPGLRGDAVVGARGGIVWRRWRGAAAASDGERQGAVAVGGGGAIGARC